MKQMEKRVTVHNFLPKIIEKNKLTTKLAAELLEKVSGTYPK